MKGGISANNIQVDWWCNAMYLAESVWGRYVTLGLYNTKCLELSRSNFSMLLTCHETTVAVVMSCRRVVIRVQNITRDLFSYQILSFLAASALFWTYNAHRPFPSSGVA